MCGQYLWTTQGAGNVACLCGGARIVDDVLIIGSEITDEAVFAAVVEEETGKPPVQFEGG